MRAHRALAVATLLTLLALGPAAGAVPGQAVLSVAPQELTFGEPVSLTGSLETDPACRGARAVQVQVRAGNGPWGPEATAVTAANGSFSVEASPVHTGGYRAVLPAETRGVTVCEQAVSAEAPVRVHAAVGLAVPSRVRGSACTDIPVSVEPPKPGKPVRVERRAGAGWEPVGEPQLDAASRAVARLCTAWPDVGETVRLRARVEGDAQNLDGQALAESVVEKAGWMRTILRLARGRSIGISVREAGQFLFRRADSRPRTPASNEKLLVSMAILDLLGPGHRFRTVAAGRAPEAGIVDGDLWLIGSGDPTTGRRSMRRLAARIADAGVTRIEGRVVGSTAFFARDWFAPGWKRSFPREEVALPSALTFQGNEAGGRHVKDPERRAAAFMTKRLRALGVAVGGPPDAGRHPTGLEQIAATESPPLARLLRLVNRRSWNLGAEVLGKRLGAEVRGPPGTIAKGADAMAAFTSAAGVEATTYDASGLSYANRIAPASLAALLELAEERPWWGALHESLAKGGQGTLGGRLEDVRVRAKTGTLTGISALSGWVWLERRGAWAEFSILSSGLPKATAMRIEDRVVRLLARRAG